MDGGDSEVPLRFLTVQLSSVSSQHYQEVWVAGSHFTGGNWGTMRSKSVGLEGTVG
jgi:hypothetical protein